METSFSSPGTRKASGRRRYCITFVRRRRGAPKTQTEKTPSTNPVPYMGRLGEQESTPTRPEQFINLRRPPQEIGGRRRCFLPFHRTALREQHQPGRLS